MTKYLCDRCGTESDQAELKCIEIPKDVPGEAPARYELCRRCRAHIRDEAGYVFPAAVKAKG